MNFGKVQQWAERIDELALRERTLLFLVVLAVAYTAAQGLLFAPMQQQRTTFLQQLKTERNRVEATNLQTQAVLTASGRTPEAKARLHTLQTRLQGMHGQLAAMTNGLVSPAQMLRLVHQVSASSAGVTLVALHNIPAVPALPQPPAAASAPTDAPPGAVLYRHGLQIVVTGRYPALVRYLKTLERLPWKVFWGQVDLKVERYPVSRLTVVLYTVNGQTGWIGG